MMHLFHHHHHLFKLTFLVRWCFPQISPRSFLRLIIKTFFHSRFYLQHSVFCAIFLAIAYAIHHVIFQVCSPMYLQPITPFLMELALQIFRPFFRYRQRFFHRKSLLGFSLICSSCFRLEHRLFQTKLAY
jgi:hypothetical protein